MSESQLPTIEEYAEYLEEDQGIKLTSSNEGILKFMRTFFTERDFNRDNFKKMIKYLIEVKQYKRDTIKRYIIVGRKICEMLHSPMLEGYKGPRIENPEPKGSLGDLISDSDMRRICEVNLPRKSYSKEDELLINTTYRAIFSLMRYSGIGPEDVSRLTWHMDRVTHFEFNRIKTGEPVLVPIVPETRAFLDSLPRHKHNRVFSSIHGSKLSGQSLRDELRKRCQALGITSWVTPYSFRYSMITWCYINAEDKHLAKLTKITGHSMSTALKHYAKYDVQTLLDALYATHPGLQQEQTIDSVKRVVISLLSKLIDTSKFEVTLEILPKNENKRTIHLS